MKNCIVTFLVIHFLMLTLYGQDQEITKGKSEFGFIENKGQIVDQNGRINQRVKYIYHLPGMNVLFYEDGFSYDIYERHTPDSVAAPVHVHRVDVDFAGRSQSVRLKAQSPATDLINVYGNNLAVTGIRHFERLLYTDVYPGIDVAFYSYGDQMKYDFILHPGASPAHINLQYRGQLSLESLSKTSYQVVTTTGNLVETIPACYEDGSGKSVAAAYSYGTNGRVGFSLGEYDHTKTIIIDPVPDRYWGTYYGGTSQESGNGTIIDDQDNIYLTGRTTSATFIATAGSYQTVLNGSVDAFLVKFASSGQRLWATYYGGSATQEGISVATDASGNVFMACFTNAGGGGQATAGSHQPVFGGVVDALLVKFNSNGSRLWATFYGGDDWDSPTHIAVDNLGNVLMVGLTQSSGGIATVGAHQTALSGNGLSDAFVVKFTTNGVRMWGTYYGGSNDDEAQSVCTDISNNVIVAGETNSPNNISTAGSHQPAIGSVNNNDMFIAQFSGAGVRLWGTYYGGTNGESAGDVCVDAGDNIVVTGTSLSANAIATPGAYQTVLNGIGDAVVVKFTNFGARVWGTYLGGTGVDAGHGIGTDASGNILVTGSTNSGNGISTPGALQGGFGGINDGFLVSFHPGGARQWGTYYGGSAYDISLEIAISECCVVICGNASSPNNIATPLSTGAYDNTLAGINDAFLVKLMVCSMQGGNWHQTTGNSYGDGGLDIAVDDCGNVYVSGIFALSTTFNDRVNPVVTINNSTQKGTAYVAKYSACGELLWVNYDDGNMGGTFSMGKALGLDDARGIVYLTGSYGTLLRFQSSAATPTTPAIPGPVEPNGSMYVAKFDMATGALIDVFQTSAINGLDYRPNGIDVRNTGNSSAQVFLCGKAENPFNVSETYAFAARLADGVGFSSAFDWTTLAIHTSGSSEANDIAYRTANNRLYVIGNFVEEITFGTDTKTTLATQDAFICHVSNQVSNGTYVSGTLRNAVVSSPAKMAWGNGVAVRQGGDVFYTGTISGYSPNFFGYSQSTIGPASIGSDNVAYVLRTSANGAYKGKAQIMANVTTPGDAVTGTGITANASGVYVTGTFADGSLAAPFNNNGSYVSDPGFVKTYTVRLRPNVFFDGFTQLWTNTTQSPAGLSGPHQSTKIAAAAFFVFTTGYYQETMQYSYSQFTPASGDLVSSSASPNPTFNTYVLRYLIGNGSLRETQDDNILIEQQPDDRNIISVYPNPASDELTIDVTKLVQNDSLVTITLVDVSGRVVLKSVRSIDSGYVYLDVSSYDPGVYVLIVESAEGINSEKIIVR